MFLSGLFLYCILFVVIYYNKNTIIRHECPYASSNIVKVMTAFHRVHRFSPLLLNATKEVGKEYVVSALVQNQTKPLLCIASTLLSKRNKTKLIAQKNCMVSLNTIPFVKSVFYTNDTFWLSYCEKSGITCSTDYDSNEYGTPFFKSLVNRIQATYDCDFYGYVNGDILFHSNLTRVLSVIKSYMSQNILKRRVLLTGRRTNIFNFTTQLVSNDLKRNDDLLVSEGRNGSLFREDALDYFIFTNSTYDWNSVYDVVIGRPLYDNYLLHIISHSPEADLVDLTPALLAIHQTDEDGVFAGHRIRPDLNWNRQLIGKELYDNYDLLEYM